MEILLALSQQKKDSRLAFIVFSEALQLTLSLEEADRITLRMGHVLLNIPQSHVSIEPLLLPLSQDVDLKGGKHLLSALWAAKNQNIQEFQERIDDAKKIARTLPEKNNMYHLEFNHSNVLLYEIEGLKILGKNKEAKKLLDSFDQQHLSLERQSKLSSLFIL